MLAGGGVGFGGGDNGVISPIRKSSEGIVAPLTAVFFVLPHFINQQPEAGSNQLSRLAARSFVPAWQSEMREKKKGMGSQPLRHYLTL